MAFPNTSFIYSDQKVDFSVAMLDDGGEVGGDVSRTGTIVYFLVENCFTRQACDTCPGLRGLGHLISGFELATTS